MDLPLLSKQTNSHPSFAGFLMFFKSFGKGKEGVRVHAHMPKSVKHEKYDFNYGPEQKEALENFYSGKNFTAEQIIESVKSCEVIGCGGSAYPMYKKLEAIKDSTAKEKILIINAVECDCGLIHDEFIMATYFAQIEVVAKKFKEAFSFDRVILGTTQKYKNDYMHSSKEIEVKRVPYGYPAGYEKILINSLTGITLEHNELPSERGILVQNVQTMLMAYYALSNNEKQAGKYITVADFLNRRAVTAFVPFGSKVSNVAKENLGEVPQGKDKPVLLLVGGGAMSGHIATQDELTTEKTCLVAYGYEPYIQNTNECMSCHACNRGCPMGIDVCKLTDLILSGDSESAKAYSPEKCIGCNTCTYVCFLNRDNSRIIDEFNKSN